MLFCNIVHVPVCEAEAQKGFGYFSSLRLEKIDRIKPTAARFLSCAAELAVCLSLCDMKIFDKKPNYFYNADSKPELREKGKAISISHSGALALCACADYEIGADIENIRCFSDKTADFFRSETDFFDFCAAETKNERLTALWTVKEAYLKLTGEGIDGRAVRDITVICDRIRPPNNKTAFYKSFSPEQGYFACLCAHDACFCSEEPDINIYSYADAIMVLDNITRIKE